MSMAKAQRPRGWWYPWIFVGGFLVGFAVTGIMAYFALSTFTGLVDARPFDRGATYNTRIAEEREQLALGWTLTMEAHALDPIPGASEGESLRPVDFAFTMLTRDGVPVEDLVMAIEVQRPVNSSYDHVAVLQPQGQGVYAARIDFPLEGQWDFLIRAESTDHEGVVFRQRERIFLR